MKEQLKAFKENRSTKLAVFTVIILMFYALFLTSKLWFPTNSDLIEATPFYQVQQYNHYNIYITRWDCAKEKGVMEITVELENKDVLDQTFVYEAVERTAGELEIQQVAVDSKYVILRVTGLDKNWKEVSLRIGEKGEDNPVKFYTNVDRVGNVKQLPKKTKAGYQISRLQDQITYNQLQVDENAKMIDNLVMENESLDKKMKELEDTAFLTEDEIKKNEEIRAKGESEKTSNQEKIAALTEESDAMLGKSQKIKEQIDALQ